MLLAEISELTCRMQQGAASPERKDRQISSENPPRISKPTAALRDSFLRHNRWSQLQPEITSAKPIPEAAIAQTHNPEAPNTYTEAAAALLREGAGKQPQVQTRSLCCSTKSPSSSPRGPHTVAVVSPPAMCCHLPSCSADAAECPNPSRRCSELPALLGELQSTGDIDASKPCCICLRPI